MLHTAELWGDVANYVYRAYGPTAGAFLALAEMIGGNSDALVERVLDNKDTKNTIRRMSGVTTTATATTVQESRMKRRVRRQITEVTVDSISRFLFRAILPAHHTFLYEILSDGSADRGSLIFAVANRHRIRMCRGEYQPLHPKT
jgi:hypothetical protein